MLERDVNDNKKIGNYGAQHILSGVPRDSVTILTHCNTGSLATAGYGTALGEIDAERNERGRRTRVGMFPRIESDPVGVCRCGAQPPRSGPAETRVLHGDQAVQPGIQADCVRGGSGGNPRHAHHRQHGGAHHERNEHHRCVPVRDIFTFGSLVSARPLTPAAICLPAVVVGADRVVANGDTANKVGTYQLAIAAKHHGVPFYVAAPSTSCDLSLESGKDIIIEVRPPEELTSINGVPIAAPGEKHRFLKRTAAVLFSLSPAFDIGLRLSTC